MKKIKFLVIYVLIQSLFINFNVACVFSKPTASELEMNEPFYFNSTRAYNLIQLQENLGPRFPGSEGIEKTRQIITSYFGSEVHWNISFQNFSKLWYDNKNITLVNLICQPPYFDPNSQYFLLLAHYDTRLWADKDPNPQKRKQPVVGANDGASGVAVILELGNILVKNHNITNFKLILFDGEDQGNIEGWDWLIGSRFFSISSEIQNKNISFGILFDMVGGEGAVFKREKYSDIYASEIVSRVWEEAKNLGYSNYFINISGQMVIDDHLPLLEKGIPTIDIIDDFINSETWHTTSDNITFISKNTLEVVGQTIESFLVNYSTSNDWVSNLSEFSFRTPLSQIAIIYGLFIVYINKMCNKKKDKKDLN